jgi:queuine tRNA-ribosyltransferase
MVAARPIDMSQFQFTIEHNQGRARVGEYPTPHGLLATPAFMPVGTQAAIKTLTPEEVAAAGVEMLLCNAYHLYLRPGVGTVQRLGGVHRFMGWSGPVLTDSGGFQIFSMGFLSRVDESGVLFRSHLDGSEHLFSPERAMANQARLGADIIMCLDHCIGYGAGKERVREAMERTHRWAEICHRFHAVSETSGRQALFGIVQGGVFEDLREESARYITSIPFQGYAIGGLAVGESKAQMYETTQQVTALLPKDRPRYLMGVGSPEDLVECVARGVDLFDCVLPTRVARHGGLFTNHGRVDITSRRFVDQAGPVDSDCDCYACRNFSAAYLCHLFRSKELLGPRLASIHNLRFIMRLMADVRRSIAEGRFEVFRREFGETYRPTDEAARREQKAKWLEARGG